MRLQILQKLWEDHSSVIYGYLLKLSRDPDFAADLLQDLFCRLGQNDALLGRMGEQPRGFLLRLAYNSLVDKVRRDQARARVFAKMGLDGSEPRVDAADPDMGDLEKALKAALEKLPEEQRTVVAGRYLGRQTFEEIAAAQGISINTAASRFRYGVDKMREELRELYDSLNGREPEERSKRMNDRNRYGEETAESADDPLIRPLEARRVPSASVLPWMELLHEPDAGLAEEGHELEPVEEAGGAVDEVEPGDSMVFLDPREWDGTWEEAEPPMGFDEIARQVLQEPEGQEIKDPAGFLGWLIAQNTIAGDDGGDGDEAGSAGAGPLQGPLRDPNDPAGRALSGGSFLMARADGMMTQGGGRSLGAVASFAIESASVVSSNRAAGGVSAVLGAAVDRTDSMSETEMSPVERGESEGGAVAGAMRVKSGGEVTEIDLARVFLSNSQDPADATAESAGVEPVVSKDSGAAISGEAVYLTGVSGRTGVGTVPGTGQPVYPAESEGVNQDGNAGNGPLEFQSGVVVADVETVRGEDSFSRVSGIQPVESGVFQGVNPVQAADVSPADSRLVWEVEVKGSIPAVHPGVEVAEPVDDQVMRMAPPTESVEWIQPSAEVLGLLNSEEEGLVPGLFDGPIGKAESGLKADTGWTTIGVAGATTVLGATGRPEKKEEE